MPRPLSLLLLTVCAVRVADAQGTKADYDRALALEKKAQSWYVGASVAPQWFDKDAKFWYRRDLPNREVEFVVVETETGKRQPAFDHAKLAEKLAEQSKREAPAKRLPIFGLEFPSAGVVRFSAFDKKWEYRTGDGSLKSIGAGDPPPKTPTKRGRFFRPPFRQPPDRGRKAPSELRVENHNLVWRENDGKSTPITTDGKAGDGYGNRLFASPNGKHVVALREIAGDDRKVTLVESSPRDQLQPKRIELPYLKPGDKIPWTKPRMFDVAGRKEVATSDALFANPYGLRPLGWTEDGSEFRFVYNERGHQVLRVLGLAPDGKTRVVIEERSPTFIDYAHKQFLHQVAKTDEAIWMSERDGWNHLYLFDAKAGKLKSQITKGEWIVRQVTHVDEAKRRIWFEASGVYPGQDPYFVHLCRIDFDGRNFVRLTSGDGTHRPAEPWARAHFVASYSRVDLPPVHELRRSEDGKVVCELERGDGDKLKAAGWKPPTSFVAKARDGKTDIYGLIFLPTNFDEKKKYPVVEDIYAGPQGSFAPKAFAAHHSMQSLAELQFVVVKIDGLGTSNRSKAFHDVCCKNLADAGLPDRKLWMQAAAKKIPQMDLSRVGVFGGSAGGQSALGALLFHPDFYKVGIADCGCHDNRMDKIWWNELWMGWPIGPHYAASSNVTHAHKLQGKLLLIVGEVDRNVDPASTYQVANALVKANKDFDFLMIPGADHGGGGAYNRRRKWDFLVRHLHGVEPRS